MTELSYFASYIRDKVIHKLRLIEIVYLKIQFKQKTQNGQNIADDYGISILAGSSLAPKKLENCVETTMSGFSSSTRNYENEILKGGKKKSAEFRHGS